MRRRTDRGAAAVEAGILAAGLAAALLGVTALLGGEVEALLRAALDAVTGG